jgi:hypothetical protein
MANLVKFPVDHAHLEHPILCSHCQNMARVLVFKSARLGNGAIHLVKQGAECLLPACPGGGTTCEVEA